MKIITAVFKSEKRRQFEQKSANLKTTDEPKIYAINS